MKTFIEALFRVLFTYDCVGEEKVPASGPAVIAANHPSYLDPILLGLKVKRPIHFMAWDALFQVPLMGALMRLFDAFPVDTRKGKAARLRQGEGLILGGEVVGIFRRQRSRTGWLEPPCAKGPAAGRETGAPLIPATIAGVPRVAHNHARLPASGALPDPSTRARGARWPDEALPAPWSSCAPWTGRCCPG